MKHRELKRLTLAIEELRSVAGESDVLKRLVLLRDAREIVERFELGQVEEARAEERTWADIGAVYGLSKQAAQRRFRQ